MKVDGAWTKRPPQGYETDETFIPKERDADLELSSDVETRPIHAVPRGIFSRSPGDVDDMN